MVGNFWRRDHHGFADEMNLSHQIEKRELSDSELERVAGGVAHAHRLVIDPEMLASGPDAKE